MKVVVGVDIGNATTEVALAKVENNNYEFLSSGLHETTGLKGTKENVLGIKRAINEALKKAGLERGDLSLIRINEATPVIGDVSMETITETIITESTMIGHNPSTPGGLGLGIGETILFRDLENFQMDKDYIVIIEKKYSFLEAAYKMNEAVEKGCRIKGAIIQKDDGVLINNRLTNKIPIVDEVNFVGKVPLGMKAAVEVAPKGKIIEAISNPYGIATIFSLTSEETKKIVPISKALIGNRSGVVIKTPHGDVKEKVIPAGKIQFDGNSKSKSVSIEEGSGKIMKTLSSIDHVVDINGEYGTNVGGMLQKVKSVMANFTNEEIHNIKIRDILAVDTQVPQKIKGGVAEEFMFENAVGIAAMVNTCKNQMSDVADEIERELGVRVEVGGVEADMAIRGALTTPGTGTPLVIVDIGAGSTDACSIDRYGNQELVHLAGAGNMTTLLIQKELGIEDFNLAEDIKKYPLAKVESLFFIRHEDGSVQFFANSLSPKVFAKNVLIKEGELIPLELDIPLEKIKTVRRAAKKKVFVTNVIRSLKKVSHTKNIRDFEFVVIVGGSALDFEISQMITESLSEYGIVAGCGNIRGTEGPRNAVATGLVMGVECSDTNCRIYHPDERPIMEVADVYKT
ncbi:diol dehydratase reactivase subunit alpha [uncultured Ilyobacter sp.]|uniref:diol dehydratase reactivase subunit alpha n=1 Tax=uncultured Ilyobacter sp. TaxID=544433 RepID=UPI0029C8BC30|nr:diol dehydratase reactivase subunit alpha [uncultured Ilyobacter sp.]